MTTRTLSSPPPHSLGPALVVTSPLDASLSFYVERVGVAFGSDSLTHAAGRLVGWLLVCEPYAQSIEQFALSLGNNRSEVSATASELVRAGYIVTLDPPHSREPIYHLHPEAWRTVLTIPTDRASELREVIEDGLALLEHATPQRRERLMSMHHLFAFIEAELLTAHQAGPLAGRHGP